MTRCQQIRDPPEAVNVSVNAHRAHPAGEFFDIGVDVRLRNLRGRVGFRLQSPGPLQEFQISSVPPLQIIATRFGKMARPPAWLET